jgi:hypothetical protein
MMTIMDIFFILLLCLWAIYMVNLWLAGKEVEDETGRILELEVEAKETWREIGENFRRLRNILLYGHPDVQDVDYEIINEEEVIKDEERMLPM